MVLFYFYNNRLTSEKTISYSLSGIHPFPSLCNYDRTIYELCIIFPGYNPCIPIPLHRLLFHLYGYRIEDIPNRQEPMTIPYPHNPNHGNRMTPLA